MKSNVSLFSCVLLFSLLLNLNWMSFSVTEVDATESEIRVLMSDFFQNLKTGETSALLTQMTGQIYYERKEILERNKQYSRILEETYRDIDFEIELIEKNDQDQYVVFVNQWKGVTFAKRMEFHCVKDGLYWKISEEL